jgi:hypothetical protein
VWKLENEVVWEVSSLIISRWAISRWRDLRATIPGNILLVIKIQHVNGRKY